MGIILRVKKLKEGQEPKMVIHYPTPTREQHDACIAILTQFGASFDNTPFKGKVVMLHYLMGHKLYAFIESSKSAENRIKAYPKWWAALQRQAASTYGGPEIEHQKTRKPRCF